MRDNIEIVVNVFTIEKGTVKILMSRKKTEPYKGYWMLPTSSFNENESLESNASLVINELGLKNVYLEQVKTYNDLNRNVLSISFLGIVDSVSVEISNISEEYSWFSVDSIPKIAYNHEELIKNNMNVLKNKLIDVNVLKKLFPSDFTLPEIQKLYEQILGKELDRRNFRKKFINLNLIEDTGYKNEGFNGRPAKLYKFKENIEKRNLF